MTSVPTGNIFLTIFWGSGSLLTKKPTLTEHAVNGGIYVSGQQLEMARFSSIIGEIYLIQLELTPNALHLFFGIPQKELVNKFLRLEDIWSTEANRLYEQVINVPDPADQISIMEKFLCGRILSRQRYQSESIAHATLLISQSRGNISIKKVASSIGISKRSLERQFLQMVGISPKSYCKIKQFNDAFRQLALTDNNIIDIAYEAGYYDQPHFINHFRQVCGMCPSKFLEAHEKFFGMLKKNKHAPTVSAISNADGELYIF